MESTIESRDESNPENRGARRRGKNPTLLYLDWLSIYIVTGWSSGGERLQAKLQWQARQEQIRSLAEAQIGEDNATGEIITSLAGVHSLIFKGLAFFA